MFTNRFSRQGFGLVLGLVVQYILGMAINLYVSFPDGDNTGQLWKFAWHSPLVAAHIVLAILLFLSSLSLLIMAYTKKQEMWKLPAWFGFGGILVAGFAGSRFIPTQQDPYSYLMALTFLVAFVSYAWGLYRTK